MKVYAIYTVDPMYNSPDTLTQIFLHKEDAKKWIAKHIHKPRLAYIEEYTVLESFSEEDN